jgi:uncharacterized membrane protein
MAFRLRAEARAGGIPGLREAGRSAIMGAWRDFFAPTVVPSVCKANLQTFFYEGECYMWTMLWPILVVVGANTMYNISAKSTPKGINAFVSLTVTYLVATLCSLCLYFATGAQKNLAQEISKINWASIVMGIVIVGLEFGFINVFRAGWKLSIANLVASIAVACVLLIVGLLFYRETLSLRQVIGMGVCAVGLALIAK